MINEDYANACAEVVRILDFIPYRDYKKIPKDVILNYEKNETIKEENIKKEKYNSNDIFKNNTKSTIIENKDNIQEKSLVNVSNIK